MSNNGPKSKKTKKKDDIFVLPNSLLGTLKSAKKRIKKAEEKYLDPLRFKIQAIEEYYKEVGITQDPKGPQESHIGEYPDLFGIKLKKNEKDDIICITPGLESHSAIKLYASLLTAEMQINRKKESLKIEEEKDYDHTTNISTNKKE